MITRATDQTEVQRRISFADAALGAAGHQVTDPILNGLARQAAGGTLTTEEAIARGLKHIDAPLRWPRTFVPGMTISSQAPLF